MMQILNQDLTLAKPVRDLCIVLGDQLDKDSRIFESFDPEQDVLWMAEVAAESVEVVSSQTRTAFFLSAMRHFSHLQKAINRSVLYFDLPTTHSAQLGSLAQVLEMTLKSLEAENQLPRLIRCVLPGDARIKTSLDHTVEAFCIDIEWLPDQHFLAEPGEFTSWLASRKSPVMEYWYRALRKRLGILMDANGKPESGKWNYDSDNRKTFAKTGPENVPSAPDFELDKISMQVINDTKALNLAGEMNLQYWPVTREQALEALQDFIEYRLALFGDYQDAMWQNEPWLYHSRISGALNVKLLHPLEVVRAVEQAYYAGKAPLNAVEGFIRQIVGWREYVRGLYWSYRDQWLSMNALNAHQALPEFFWTGNTQMNCMAQSLKQVVHSGYGHHIQRLMVTGLFSLLYGIKPEAIHQWYLAMYVDAVAWVEIPNTLGMSQFADGGIVGSKPYIASGAYIDRMSNYCKHCKYQPKIALGEKACPFTTLYWDFVARHSAWLEGHPRLGMQVKNWQRKSENDQKAIRAQASELFKNIEVV